MSLLDRLGGRPSSRRDELRPAVCMSCGRGVRLNPSEPLAMQPECRCGAAMNWRVTLGPGEPDQLICGAFPQPFAQRDRLRKPVPGRGAVVSQALDILRKGLGRGEG